MKPLRCFVAAPDASPEQIALGGPYKRKQALEIAAAWNQKHPALPVVIYQRQST